MQNINPFMNLNPNPITRNPEPGILNPDAQHKLTNSPPHPITLNKTLINTSNLLLWNLTYKPRNM